MAPPEVWEAVRLDYCAGLSGAECVRRHGVGLSTLRARAAHEKWRRSDQDWVAPVRPIDFDTADLLEKTGGNLDRIDLCELSYICSRRMMQATLDGDAVAALRWRRVRLALDAEEREIEAFNAAWENERDARLFAEQEAESREARARVKAEEGPDSRAPNSAPSDSSDSSDSVFESDPSGARTAAAPPAEASSQGIIRHASSAGFTGNGACDRLT